MEKPRVVFINNSIIPVGEAKISILDQSVQYGWGLFETIKVNNGNPVMIAEHIDRIFSSASKFNIKVMLDKAELVASVDKFIKALGIDNFALKIVFAKGIDSSSSIFFTHREIPYTQEDYKNGNT